MAAISLGSELHKLPSRAQMRRPTSRSLTAASAASKCGRHSPGLNHAASPMWAKLSIVSAILTILHPAC